MPAEVKLSLNEIEILIYLLNGRSSLGGNADSAKAKLNKARREILGKQETSAPPSKVASGDAWVGPTGETKRDTEFNKWDRRRESSEMPLLKSLE